MATTDKDMECENCNWIGRPTIFVAEDKREAWECPTGEGGCGVISKPSNWSEYTEDGLEEEEEEEEESEDLEC